ncbi:acyl-CoA thioesterase [Sphingobacterium sp. PCS056]|uniref:acyl-CoA thioesterase n=1 Tax=Sphingobacterium TaxID=28453 RepID=UPI00200D7D86|nr:acyl-CoA thioesterase [Sphingobacterium sp. PCS056]UPZ38105.1 acyl-CoA thioesterase [Sphingobacterium sp. PCS056]
MEEIYKKAGESVIRMSQLMLPSNANFGGKIHGGYVLSLMDQIAFAVASKFSGHYCVTASVGKVNFLKPIEVGELITLIASVNYVGNTSMEVGIRVESMNIQSGEIKHCNSSYFTMVAKDEHGNSVRVPRLILSNEKEVFRFYKSIIKIEIDKERERAILDLESDSEEQLNYIRERYDVKITL